MLNETEVKYLAGLIDADGYIGYEFQNNRVTLRLQLSAAESIDKEGYVLKLPETTGFGSSHTKSKRVDEWAPVTVWVVQGRRDIEMLLPRLIKHMVIKGKHAQRMLDSWQEYRGKVLSDLTIEQLKQYKAVSRLDTGPVRDKKHPSWAWVAGYLDGDGSYMFSHPPSYKKPRLLVQATAHENDRVGVDLLYKAFGGTLNNRGKTCPHILDWKHSLGVKDKDFAKDFLGKMVQHTKLKKHKIEQMLSYINGNYKGSHRLNEVPSTEEAIVGRVAAP